MLAHAPCLAATANSCRLWMRRCGRRTPRRSLLACRIGCTQCCYGAFAIGPLDALRLRAGMEDLRSTDPALAATLELRARAWIAAHDGFPGEPLTGVLGRLRRDRSAFEDFADDAACRLSIPSPDAATSTHSGQ